MSLFTWCDSSFCNGGGAVNLPGCLKNGSGELALASALLNSQWGLETSPILPVDAKRAKIFWGPCLQYPQGVLLEATSILLLLFDSFVGQIVKSGHSC